MGFLINSHIRSYIQQRPYLLAGQGLIDAANHVFLIADSYADCNELYEFEDLELDNNRGVIQEQAKKAIKVAVTRSKTIAPYHKKLILS